MTGSKRIGGGLANLEDRGPLVRDSDVFVIGARRADGALSEVGALGIPVWTADEVRSGGAAATAREACRAASFEGGHCGRLRSYLPAPPALLVRPNLEASIAAVAESDASAAPSDEFSVRSRSTSILPSNKGAR